MCKTHSKVTHIKEQQYFHHLKGRGDNKDCVLYPRATAFEVIKIFLLFYMCHFTMALTHIYKTSFFTFIFAVFLLNLIYSFRQTLPAIFASS